MRKTTEILRLYFEAKLSKHQIARSLCITHSTVSEVLKRFAQAKLSWPLLDSLDEAGLESRLYPINPQVNPNRPQPNFAFIHQELRRPNVTLALLWNEYKELHPLGYQYSQFCELYRGWSGKLDVSLRQVHKAGEKAHYRPYYRRNTLSEYFCLCFRC